jgi:hypothetical protein
MHGGLMILEVYSLLFVASLCPELELSIFSWRIVMRVLIASMLFVLAQAVHADAVPSDRQEQIAKIQSLPLDLQEQIAKIQSSPQPTMSNGQKNVTKNIGTVASVSPQACPPEWWIFWPEYCFSQNGNIVVYDNVNNVYVSVRDSDSKQIAANACQGGNPTLIHMSSCTTYSEFFVFRALDRAGYDRP